MASWRRHHCASENTPSQKQYTVINMQLGSWSQAAWVQTQALLCTVCDPGGVTSSLEISVFSPVKRRYWYHHPPGLWGVSDGPIHVKSIRDCLVQAVAGDGGLCVLQVGSFGNGTALRNTLEVELVAFLSCFHSFQQEAKHHQAILSLIWKKLWCCRDLLALGLEDVEIVQGVPNAVVFTIQTRRTAEPITVTIVPAYRALGKGRRSPSDSHTCHPRET